MGSHCRQSDRVGANGDPSSPGRRLAAEPGCPAPTGKGRAENPQKGANAASDGNPATQADPNWLPLFDPSVPVSGPPLVTPGFPDHPAGHTCISGATVRALRAFFGTDKVSFTAVSNKCSPAPCPPRSFDRFSVALKEIIDARVWGGIHFRTADVVGNAQGQKVANWALDRYFQPVN